MATTMDDWAAEKNGGADHDMAHEHEGVDEAAILGGAEGDEAHSAFEHQEPSHGAAIDDGAAAAAKKKKSTQTMIAAAVCGAVVIGMGGLVVMKKRNMALQQQAQAQEEAQASAQQQQQPPQAPDAGSTIAQVGAPTPNAQPIITEHADGSPATPAAPDFGLQAPGAQAASQAAQSIPSPAPSMQGPAVARLGVQSTPVGPGVTPMAQVSPSVAPQPMGKQPQQVVGVADTNPAATSAAEVSKMREEIAALKAQVSDIDALRAQVAELRTQAASPKPAARPAASPHPVNVAKAAPRVVARPAQPTVPTAAQKLASATSIAETVTPIPTPSTPASMKGKVRSDFRIYANVDGRFWLKGPDGEPTQIAPRSPLSDGSRVTSVDAEKNIVYTTSGEIH